MKFLVDEWLSPSYVRELRDAGYPDAVHPIHVGLCGRRDDEIAERALADDRIILTSNAADYRRILAGTPIHPGAAIVQPSNRDGTWLLIRIALGYLMLHSNPADYMINRIVEVASNGALDTYEAPSTATG